MFAASLLLPLAAANAAVIDFEDLPYEAGQYQPTPTVNGDHVWDSGIGSFTMNVTYNGAGWTGFKGSAGTDTTKGDYDNDCSSIAGSGANGSLRYGILYANMPFASYTEGNAPAILQSGGNSVSFNQNVEISSIDISNTTYFYKVAESGNSYAEPLSAAQDGAYVDLIIRATGYVDGVDSEVRLTLAGKNGGVVSMFDDWKTVDLSELNPVDGLGIAGLEFVIESNFIVKGSEDYYNPGQYYYSFNLPSYVAFDNISYNAIPEPAAFAALFGLLAFAVVSVKRRAAK